MVWAVGCVLALAILPARVRAEEVEPTLTPAQLSDVTITQEPDSTVVRLKTSGAATYRAEFMDSPDRLVIDLDDTVYAWRKAPLKVGREPLKQIRGSQYRKGVSRVVMEFSHKVGYAIREDAEGLAVIIPTGLASTKAASAAETTPVPEPTAKPRRDVSTESQPAPMTPPAGSPPAAATTEPAAPVGVVLKEEPLPSVETGRPTAVPPAPPRRSLGGVAQVQPAPTAPAPPAQRPTPPPAAAPARPGSQHLISLEFKDADVVNLLRILAAESGRNIVIGEDVRGKMSITLRNVPWDLALSTILEAKGLQRIDRDGVMRIVTTEQLTKEREAEARVQEAKLKAEAEARAKMAEAKAKEAAAELAQRATEASIREAEARGPLREEMIRLSYADPEEVAKTLQGILGIPPTTGMQKIEGPGVLTGGTYGPIAEPPFSQLFGPPTPPPPPPAVSVSQDVLAKGLTIRAHKPTNTIFLRLYAADLERVKKLIRESLDIPLPQVKIEARLEVLERTALEQLGIQWGGAVANPAGSQTLVGQGLQTATLNGQTVPFLPGAQVGSGGVLFDPVAAQRLNLGSANTSLSLSQALPVSSLTGLPLGGNLVNLPITALPNAGPLPAFGVNFGIIGTRFNVNLALQALASLNKTRTLARPEIVTVENNKATMSLGEEIPYATISSAGTQIQFKEALLKLEVTPTVIREPDANKIKMLVVVEDNSRGDVINLGNAGTPPAINKRKAETQVLLKEGERLIIGGVTRTILQNTVRKAPLLGDIPVLGWLFKQKEDFEQGRELVVFLTPSVLRVDSAATSTAAPAPPTPALPAPAPK
jgi:type IV pilus assembly protein PilQ